MTEVSPVGETILQVEGGRGGRECGRRRTRDVHGIRERSDRVDATGQDTDFVGGDGSRGTVRPLRVRTTF